MIVTTVSKSFAGKIAAMSILSRFFVITDYVDVFFIFVPFPEEDLLLVL